MNVEQTIFLVRVQPRAKRNAVQPAAGAGLKVYVTAPPEDGRANEAVVEAIAKWLGVKRRQVEIVSGATNRNKVVRVTNVSRAQLDAALRPTR
ncbi:MAG: DUF167 domain-containing protein [Bryobacteraceae bacterium]